MGRAKKAKTDINEPDGQVFVWICRRDVAALRSYIAGGHPLPDQARRWLQRPLRTPASRQSRGGGGPRDEAAAVNVTRLWSSLMGDDEDRRRHAVGIALSRAVEVFDRRDGRVAGGILGAAPIKTKNIDAGRLSADGSLSVVSGGLPELGKKR